MCIQVPGQPFRLVLKRSYAENGTLMEIYTYVLGKVTELRNGEHKSLRDFSYPLWQTVHDPNAEAGSHAKGLHLIANPASDQLNEYGSHPLAVLPVPQLWDPPIAKGEQPLRCWHSSGVTPLVCLTCDGLTEGDLKNPTFWHEVTKPRRRMALRRRQGNSDDFVLRLPRSAVWHKEREVSLQAT
jgi:hypothetical protein